MSRESTVLIERVSRQNFIQTGQREAGLTSYPRFPFDAQYFVTCVDSSK